MIYFFFPYRSLLKARRLTERTLVDISRVSRGCIRAIVGDNKNCSLNSIVKLADAFDYKVSVLVSSEEGLSEYSIVAISLKLRQDGVDSWKIHLMEFVDEFRRSLDCRLILLPPVGGLDPPLRALLASTVMHLCAEIDAEPPAWARERHYLETPWFLSGMNSLKASALLESPVAFRRNNLFVHENFLARV